MAEAAEPVYCDWRVTADANCVGADALHILHGIALGLYATAVVLNVTYLLHRRFVLHLPFFDSFGSMRALEGLMLSLLAFFIMLITYHAILFTGQPVVSLLGIEVIYGVTYVVGFFAVARYLIVLIKAVPSQGSTEVKQPFMPNNAATRALITAFIVLSLVEPVISGLSSQYPDYDPEVGYFTTRYYLLMGYQAFYAVACTLSATLGQLFAVYLYRILGFNLRKLLRLQLGTSTSGTGSNSQIESEARAQASRRRSDLARIMVTIVGVCGAFYSNGGVALVLCVWRVPIQSHPVGTIVLAAIYWLSTPFMAVQHHIGCLYFALKGSNTENQGSSATPKPAEIALGSTTGSVTLDNALEYLGKE